MEINIEEGKKKHINKYLVFNPPRNSQLSPLQNFPSIPHNLL